MHSAILSVKLLKATIFVLFLLSPPKVCSQSVPLQNGFAHNDYFHPRPLLDALDNGYTYIEADVFLVDGELIVAHFNPFFRGRKTLEELYLMPLAKRITQNKGQVFGGYNTPIVLMIDIKTGAEDTYERLRLLLTKYSVMLSRCIKGVVTGGPVTIVLSGHKPYKMVRAEEYRLAFIDEDLQHTGRDSTALNVYTLSSCKYSKILKWNGKGEFPDAEKDRLCAYVDTAHRLGRKVRLWASPEKAIVWEQLLNCGVDLINTDKRPELKDFLLVRSQRFYGNSTAMLKKLKQELSGITWVGYKKRYEISAPFLSHILLSQI